MANEIDAALITQFSDMVHVKAQQGKSRLRPYFPIKKMSGDIWAYDGLGLVEATEQNDRISPTQFNSIDHLRRKVARRRFVVTLPIDSSDVRAVLTNPQNDYAGACSRAIERVFDRVGIEAAFATVYTGRLMDNAVTFASDGGLTINATAGFTYEIMLEMKRKFTNNEVGNDVPERFVFLCTGDEEEAMMLETELTSGDFTRQYVIDKGEVTKAVGFDIIKYGASVSSPLLNVSSNTRDCIACSERGIAYGMSLDLKLQIAERPDYVETTQVQAIIQLGAVRTEGVLVQKVQTTVQS